MSAQNWRAPRGHAIVMGGSVAGLMAARVLSDHYARITIVERDALVDEPCHRKGTPQSHHVHSFLPGGLRVLEQFIPEISRDLIAHGALLCDTGLHTKRLSRQDASSPRASGIEYLLLSRPLFEWRLRAHVLRRRNITIECGSVKGVVLSSDRKRVTGARVKTASDVETVVDADCLVDASGRGSQLPQWLADFGLPCPEETIVDARWGYASRFYRRPKESASFRVIATLPDGIEATRGAVVADQEDGRRVVTLLGVAGDLPPADEAGFAAFLHSLGVPAFDEALAHEPVGDIRTSRSTLNRRRHYERIRLPAGLFVIGDATCALNPVYGQGMTVAMFAAEALGKALSRWHRIGPLLPPGAVEQSFHQALSRAVKLPWSLSTGADTRVPGVGGAPPGPTASILLPYALRLSRLARTDLEVRQKFDETTLLVRRSRSWALDPRTLAKVIRQWKALGTPDPPRADVDARKHTPSA